MSDPKDEKKGDDNAHSDPWAPAKKLAAIAAGFLAIAFAFSLGATELSTGAIRIERVFDILIKISIGLGIVAIIYHVLKGK